MQVLFRGPEANECQRDLCEARSDPEAPGIRI